MLSSGYHLKCEQLVTRVQTPAVVFRSKPPLKEGKDENDRRYESPHLDVISFPE